MKKFFLWLCLGIALSQIGIFAWFAGRAAGMNLLPAAYMCAFMVVFGVVCAAAALRDLGLFRS